MRVLIIGGTRFVGYNIVKKLLQDGHRVAVFNRGKTDDDLGPGVEHLKGDRRDDRKFAEIFRGKHFDVIVDVIGYKAQNVECSVKAFAGNIGHYVFISTGQVYLVTENRHQPSREEDFDQPLIKCPAGSEDAWFYGVEKRECEKVLMKAYEKNKFPVTVLRLPIIHGPGDHTLRTYSYLLRILDGGPVILPDGGNTTIRHIYVADVAQTVSEIIENEETKGETYNLAQKEVMDLRGFIELCAKLMKHKVKFVSVSSLELLHHGLDPAFSPYSGQWISFMDITKAEQELGFRPTPVRKWLRTTIDWFLNKYQGEKPPNYALRSRERDFAQKLMMES